MKQFLTSKQALALIEILLHANTASCLDTDIPATFDEGDGESLRELEKEIRAGT